MLSGCGGGASSDPSVTINTPNSETTDQNSSNVANPSVLPRNDVRSLDQLYAYRRNGKYANVLSDCMLIQNWRDGCTLETLPFIFQENNNITVADIMNRVVVTHDWMGERFEQFLNSAPPSMIALFGSVTSVRIGSTVRPSNYSPGTGAISIDPAYLWQTVQEKQTVSFNADYRSGFGNQLLFQQRRLWRIDGYNATKYFALDDYSVRSAADVEFALNALMYHELAHAYDVVSAVQIGSIDSSLNVVEVLWNLPNEHLSSRLAAELPLVSDTMIDMGRVLYDGEDATDDQKEMDAYFIGAEMANDGASKMYSYRSRQEDFANLFETVMMKIQYNANQYIAVVTKPEDPNNYYCDDLTVAWGTRNRLSDPLVNTRANRVMELILKQRWSEQATQTLSAYVQQVDDMTPGVSWCANRDADLPAAAVSTEDVLSNEELLAAEQKMLLNEVELELQHD